MRAHCCWPRGSHRRGRRASAGQSAAATANRPADPPFLHAPDRCRHAPPVAAGRPRLLLLLHPGGTDVCGRRLRPCVETAFSRRVVAAARWASDSAGERHAAAGMCTRFAPPPAGASTACTAAAAGTADACVTAVLRSARQAPASARSNRHRRSRQAWAPRHPFRRRHKGRCAQGVRSLEKQPGRGHVRLQRHHDPCHQARLLALLRVRWSAVRHVHGRARLHNLKQLQGCQREKT